MEKKPSNESQNIGHSIIRFSPESEKFGGVQKFVLIKSNNGFHFGSLPMGEAKNHVNIVDELKKETDGEFEILGGGDLTLFNKEITLNQNSYSWNKNIGHLKITWGELQNIVQKIVGDKYEVLLS